MINFNQLNRYNLLILHLIHDNDNVPELLLMSAVDKAEEETPSGLLTLY